MLLSVIGMMVMVSAVQPDDAVSRARAAIARALRAGGVRARRTALVRGRAQVFRARRARFGAAALRHLAGLWLLRHDGFRGAREDADAARDRFARPDRRHRVHPGRPRVQDLRRAVPYVDARCLRGLAHAGHGVLLHRAQGRRVRAAAAHHDHAVRPSADRLAAADRPGLHRLDDPRRAGGDRADQHQAADGVFLDRPYGLRADRPRGRHARRRARRADLPRSSMCS